MTVELNVIHDRASAVRALCEVQELVMGFENEATGWQSRMYNEIVFEGEGVELYEMSGFIPQGDQFQSIFRGGIKHG